VPAGGDAGQEVAELVAELRRLDWIPPTPKRAKAKA
jgi:hypothetical protein